MEIWVIIAIPVVILFIAVGLYNRLVALRQETRNAFADIEAQLKLRLDLVPNLVETVKGYAAHEKQVLENVTAARSRAMAGGGANERMEAEAGLSRALINLMAVAENYPDLKANSNFADLQRELSDIENKIAAARRFFNNAVTEYNTALEQVPNNFIAAQFQFKAAEMFALNENEKSAAEKAPEVRF